jgi:hypothetical protein
LNEGFPLKTRLPYAYPFPLPTEPIDSSELALRARSQSLAVAERFGAFVLLLRREHLSPQCLAILAEWAQSPDLELRVCAFRTLAEARGHHYPLGNDELSSQSIKSILAAAAAEPNPWMVVYLLMARMTLGDPQAEADADLIESDSSEAHVRFPQLSNRMLRRHLRFVVSREGRDQTGAPLI